MNAERLLALAAHLESGALGHDVFDFAAFNMVVQGSGAVKQYRDVPAGVCGTNGCALGECPILFPDDWYFGDRGIPMLRGLKDDNMSFDYSPFALPLLGAMQFFDIVSEQEVKGLFFELVGIRAAWNTFVLTGASTKEQVAIGIRNYVACCQERKT